MLTICFWKVRLVGYWEGEDETNIGETDPH